MKIRNNFANKVSLKSQMIRSCFFTNIDYLLFLTITMMLSGCAAMQNIDWNQVNYNMQQQQALQSAKKQNTQSQVVQQQTQYVQPQQAANSNSERLQRENSAKQIENEGASLARQTSDYSKAQAIRLSANSLANRVRNGEISFEKAQAQLKGSQTQQNNQTQQGIQTVGWYYLNPQYGNPTKTSVRLIVQKRETGTVHSQYLILSIDGKTPHQSTLAFYESSTGLYVFNMGSTKVYFNL